MDVESAKQSGAMMLFGEKYGDRVRVLSMGSAGPNNKAFSVELCGGTHVNRTGDIGLFKIVSESGIAAGVRRIEAITGSAAINHFEELEAQLDQLADLLKSDRTGLLKKAETLVAQNREIGKEVEKLRVKLANTSGSDLSEDAVEISGIKVLAKSLEGVDAKSLRDLVDQMKNKLGSGVVLLATVSDDKVAMVCGVTKDLTDQLQAGKLLAHVAEQVGGKGGGRPDMAQGGGNQPENLDSAIASFSALIESTLG
jgi:alanyl-tRNA synthetase